MLKSCCYLIIGTQYYSTFTNLFHINGDYTAALAASIKNRVGDLLARGKAPMAFRPHLTASLAFSMISW
jgi:hypothetical protein